jgi:alanyl-tRNA synthetase
MSTPTTSEEIRADFLSFFEEKGHTVVESAPLVPDDDPTLLFVNAGMNQFKDVFLETGDRPYDRAADSQKCLRVSGKHNDLEEVGHDTYHHTFFEMLGNWSFGDYFKKEAVRYAWELLTERWELAPERLYATVHEGDDALGLDADDEAARFWESETGIDPEHILYEPSKENFWMMGDTGPCGPCSEVHVDLRPDEARRETPGRALVNADHPQVMEIWNLVFIQFNAQDDGALEPLPCQHVDTGMGFERMVAVLQDKSSTYDTDLFAPLLEATCDLTPLEHVHDYDKIEADEVEREQIRVALRVVADHVRTGAFAVADGVTPGNEGRNYVIRRILRRAVRYGYQTLELREPFLCKLVRPLAEKMGDHFDELAEQQRYIEQVIHSEEEAFLETLGTGIDFFERLAPYVKDLATTEESTTRAEQDVLDELREDRKALDLLDQAYVDTTGREAVLEGFSSAGARREVPGEVAFLLHDTYGFPIDLTRLMAREEGLGVDMDRYDELMRRQRERARAASSFAASDNADWQIVSDGPDSTFIGYEQLTVDDARIRALRTVEDDGNEHSEVILDHTPFFAESGGQVGDTGTLTVGGETIRVVDTQKQQDAVVHTVERLPDQPDAPIRAEVDADRRERAARHHTATHLLHAALRETLGDHVQQKGSLVAPDRLRFDFSHHQGVTPDELASIERQVNDAIQRSIPKQEDRDVPIEEAKRRGATALFGEKYGDRVRVITFDPDYSVELCGGTHAASTGELGLFRFLDESSVAAGVRRVEAVAGPAALEHVRSELNELQRVRGQFRSTQTPPSEQIRQLQRENQRLKSELGTIRQNQLQDKLHAFIDDAETVGHVRVVTGRYDDALDMDALTTLGNTLRDRLGAGGVGVLGAAGPESEKAYLVVTVADDLIERGLKAGNLAGALAQRVGGGGGGRPTLASAGGREPEKLTDALAAARDEVRERL